MAIFVWNGGVSKSVSSTPPSSAGVRILAWTFLIPGRSEAPLLSLWPAPLVGSRCRRQHPREVPGQVRLVVEAGRGRDARGVVAGEQPASGEIEAAPHEVAV